MLVKMVLFDYHALSCCNKWYGKLVRRTSIFFMVKLDVMDGYWITAESGKQHNPKNFPITSIFDYS